MAFFNLRKENDAHVLYHTEDIINFEHTLRSDLRYELEQTEDFCILYSKTNYNDRHDTNHQTIPNTGDRNCYIFNKTSLLFTFTGSNYKSPGHLFRSFVHNNDTYLVAKTEHGILSIYNLTQKTVKNWEKDPDAFMEHILISDDKKYIIIYGWHWARYETMYICDFECLLIEGYKPTYYTLEYGYINLSPCFPNNEKGYDVQYDERFPQILCSEPKYCTKMDGWCGLLSHYHRQNNRFYTWKEIIERDFYKIAIFESFLCDSNENKNSVIKQLLNNKFFAEVQIRNQEKFNRLSLIKNPIFFTENDEIIIQAISDESNALHKKISSQFVRKFFRESTEEENEQIIKEQVYIYDGHYPTIEEHEHNNISNMLTITFKYNVTLNNKIVNQDDLINLSKLSYNGYNEPYPALPIETVNALIEKYGEKYFKVRNVQASTIPLNIMFSSESGTSSTPFIPPKPIHSVDFLSLFRDNIIEEKLVIIIE